MAHIDLLQNDIATNPQSGYYRVYFKSDGFPYFRNNAGTETAFTVGSLSSYVTLDTAQTITGAKTLSSPTTHTAPIYIDNVGAGIQLDASWITFDDTLGTTQEGSITSDATDFTITASNSRDLKLVASGDIVLNNNTKLSVVGATAAVTPLATDASGNIVDGSTIPKPAESTGVLTGGVLSTGAGATEFSISDGTGQIVTAAGVPTAITWSGIANITPTNIGTTARTYIAIDSGGLLVESSTDFTIDQSRTLIILGIVLHLNSSTVNAVNNQQHIAYNAISSTYDLAEAIGIFNISGNLFSGNGVNLNMDKSVGTLFRAGTNYANDINNPHETTNALTSQQSFTYIFNNNVPGATGIAIDPANLDDGAGATVALSNNTKWSVQRIYLFSSGIVAVQRGVEEFNSMDDAINGIDGEAYTIASSIEPNALLRGWLVARKDTTDLTDITEAKFIEAPKFGSGGGASGGSPSLVDLQTAYNNSITPEILTDATRGALTVKQGSGADTDFILEGLDGSDVITFAVRADGCIRATTLDVVHLAATTDDHALEIDADAAGFGDVKALDIDYITGAIGAGDDEAVILVNIDQSGSSGGGDIVALEVLTTTGDATTTAILAGPEVGVVEQTSGVFGDMDSALVNATDRLTEFTTIGSDIVMFVANGDTVTIGNAAKFEDLEFLLATVSSKNINPTFEYSTGVGTWGTFTPIDGTNGLLNTGVIAWLDADIPSWAVGTGTEYLIRMTRNRGGSITSPIESLVQIAETTEFYWNKDGDVKVNNVEASSTATFGGLVTASADLDVAGHILVTDTTNNFDEKILVANDIFDAEKFSVTNRGNTYVGDDLTVENDIILNATVAYIAKANETGVLNIAGGGRDNGGVIELSGLSATTPDTILFKTSSGIGMTMNTTGLTIADALTVTGTTNLGASSILNGVTGGSIFSQFEKSGATTWGWVDDASSGDLRFFSYINAGQEISRIDSTTDLVTHYTNQEMQGTLDVTGAVSSNGHYASSGSTNKLETSSGYGLEINESTGAISPLNNVGASAIGDLGTLALPFRRLYLSSTANIIGQVDMGANLNVDGAVELTGNEQELLFASDYVVGQNDRAKINAEGAGGGSGFGGDLVFSTRNSSNVYSEALRLTNAGDTNVGGNLDVGGDLDLLANGSDINFGLYGEIQTTAYTDFRNPSDSTKGFRVDLANGIIRPITTNAVDLGTDTLRFKDAYLSGDLDVSGASTLTGDIDLVNSTEINTPTFVEFKKSATEGIRIDPNNGTVRPITDNNTELGITTRRWSKVWGVDADFSGTASITQLLHLDSYPTGSTTDGDIWRDGNDFKCRVGGVTKTFTLT